MVETVSAEVRAVLAPAARYLALVTQTNPYGSADALLRRPDIDAMLADALSAAHDVAASAVEQAWFAAGAAPDATYRQLLNDVARQYAALAHLRGLIRHAHASVPQRHFIRGRTTPGAHPSHQAAAARSQAVRDAVLRFAGEVSLRSSLSVVTASRAARTARTLAEADVSGQRVFKRWKAHPERPTCCHWCRNLHGVTIGLHDSFVPYIGGPADLSGHGRLTQPPRPYRGELQGPGLHPRCQCEIEIVREPAAQQVTVAVSRTAVFISSAEIRSMPAPRYRSLVHFLHAALHELGQVLRRLAGVR